MARHTVVSRTAKYQYCGQIICRYIDRIFMYRTRSGLSPTAPAAMMANTIIPIITFTFMRSLPYRQVVETSLSSLQPFQC